MEIQFLQAKGTNFRKGRRDAIQYIVIHYTGNDGDTAKANASYFNRTDVGTSAHYFVDKTEIWQSVKDENTAFHCGTSGTYRHPDCRNDNSIGIEICSMKDSAGDWALHSDAVERAATLCRMLMDKHSIDKSHILRHYDVTSKHCPAPFVEAAGQWEDFLMRLEAMDVQDIVVKVGEREVPAKLIDGVTYVELRPLIEAMKEELEVTWDAVTKKAGVDL